MRAPISWLAEHVDLPSTLTPRQVGEALVRTGLEVERVESAADTLSGPIVLGRVLSFTPEPQKNGKTIRWCSVDVGEGEPRGIVCGASNFAEGDLIVASLPGAVLPGGFAIAARKTYGHVSDGMICSVRELGIGDDHDGILVLPPDAGLPGQAAVQVLGLDDAVLDIAVTPDRGYCLSVRGLAREAAASLEVPFTDVHADLPAVDGAVWGVSIADPTGCDEFSLRGVQDLDPTARTPLFIVDRLRACGMRSISLAVDVTNYVMLETGQPLHAFDRAKLAGSLVARRAEPGEKLTTLDGVARVLDTDDMVVADDSGAVAIAGVMGGASTEIDEHSTAVLLEAAHWDPASISRAVRRHKLPSEAAKRFERGVDPAVAAVALQRCVDLLVEHGGARPADGFTVVGDGPVPAQITLDPRLPGALAGMPIDDLDVRRRLEQVGCAVDVDVTHYTVTPPSWRPDLVDPAGLAEEVIRLEGYDRIPSVLPTPPPGSGLTELQKSRAAVSRALAGAGYLEVLSYPFVSPELHDVFRLAADDPRRRAVRLANPLSETEPEMRTSLLPGLVAVAQRNLSRGAKDVAVFEMGLVFLATRPIEPVAVPGVDKRPSDAELDVLRASVPDQPRHVAMLLAGDREPAGWWGAAEPGSWADAIEAARTVAATMRVTLEIRAAEYAPWHPGRCAELVLDGTVVGHAGELDPRVLADLHLPPRTAAMELDLDALGVPEPAQTPVLSTFPPVLLDLALVVDADVPSTRVQDAVVAGAGELLESSRLFDVFADSDRLGDGKRSLAFSLVFRAPDRTLTVEEATAARDEAVAEAGRRVGAQLRA